MKKYHVLIVAGVLVTMILICASVSQAQTDTTAQVDRIHLRNGSVLEGKVTVIKTDVVEFIERETNLTYEFKKTDISVIVLSSGKSITFADESAPKNEQPQQQNAQPTIIEKDSGAPVGLVILATVGAVLIILILVGAAASS